VTLLLLLFLQLTIVIHRIDDTTTYSTHARTHARTQARKSDGIVSNIQRLFAIRPSVHPSIEN
jgi:hypothetical protein